VGARNASGRFAVLRSPAPPPDDLVERAARQFLRRWGVVCRDILARETRAPAWRELAVVYRRMEARGEIRGGRFLAGTVGEHFALPEAVDTLRAVRRSEKRSERIVIAAADPLNLAGIIGGGSRIAPASTEPLTYIDGVLEQQAAPSLAATP
jgi:ATP-dependent Lhr-like helicase